MNRRKYDIQDKEQNEKLWDKWQLEIVKTLETINEPFKDFAKNTNDIKETIFMEVA